MTVLAALKVVLGLDTGPFQKGATQAQLQAQQMAGKMQAAGRAVAAAGAAIMGSMVVSEVTRMAQAGLEYASALGETAQQLGVTTDALQEYRYAATQVGLSGDEMDQALGQLTRRIGEAANGTKAQVEAFKKLGISVKDAKGNVIDAGTAIPLIAEALKAVQSPAERAAVLVDLFGKSGQKLAPLLSEGAKGVNDLRAAARDMGIVLTPEMIERADKAADKFGSLKTVLDMKIAMVVAENSGAILELANALERLAERAAAAYQALKNLAQTDFGKAVRWAGGAAMEYNPISLSMKGLGQGIDLYEQAKPKGGGGRTPLPGSRRPAAPWSGATYGVPPALSARRNLAAAGDGFDLAPGLRPLIDLQAVRKVQVAFADMRREVTSPDLVDGIAAQMARLDGAMVPPATKATKETAEAFRKLANEVQPLLDRLFPEARAFNDWRADLATLERAEKGGLLTSAQATEARLRLNRQAIGGTLEEGGAAFGNLLGGAFDRVRGSFTGFTDDMDEVRAKLIDANQRIGKSFTDMAQEAVRAIGTLGHAIKDGDFFDILDAVVGLGLQLGGMGLFGQSAAKAINGARIPGYAGGTRWHPGGLAVVGERGPELVSLPRGVSVTPNGAWGASGGGMTVHQHFSGNLMTNEFWDRINAGHQAAAQAGARGGASMVAQRQSRTLGR